MEQALPTMRKDLELLPVQQGGRQLILVRDHLGLVREGQALDLSMYQVLAMLDGTTSVRDLQMALMRSRGGVLVDSGEVLNLIKGLDASFLLDSERFREARERIIRQFMALETRPCSHGGTAYPDNPVQLKRRLDEILNSSLEGPALEGGVAGLVAPHIDLAVGERLYARAYRTIRETRPSKVLVLGVGHHLEDSLFSLTTKDYETPLGRVATDRRAVQLLKEAGEGIVSPHDFSHRSEHSIEFQLLFLQHLLRNKDFSLIPVLCGSAKALLPEYTREAYLEKVKPFIAALRGLVQEEGDGILLVAGVDFSHIGPKFGHEAPAQALKAEAEAHDKRLLQALARRDPDAYWEESRRVEDRYHVCGFTALASLLEVLPPGRGHLLGHEMWFEAPTRSAVSFAAMAFTRE